MIRSHHQRAFPNKRQLAITAVSALTAGILILGAFAVPVAIASVQRSQATTFVAPLGEPSDDASDKLSPETLSDHGIEGVDTNSVRHLGSADATDYWVGVDSAGQICLLAQPSSDTSLLASSCVPPDWMKGEAIPLIASTSGWNAEAYLVPNGTDVSKLARGWRAVGTNLLVVDPKSAGFNTVSLKRSNTAGNHDDLAPLVIMRELRE